MNARSTRPRRLSHDAARRIALGAQGFAQPRPAGKVTRRHLRRVFANVGIIQIDSVNVLVRSQELPLFARLGPHPRTLIPDAVAAGELFEYWAHAASLIPSEHHHLWRWKMDVLAERWRPSLADNKPEVIADVRRQVATRGPLAVGDFDGRVRKRGGTWWSWDETKQAVEYLFAAGEVTATRRRRDFARLYDLPERVLPADALATPAADEATARAEIVMQAARSLGVATLKDLAFYHHQKPTGIKPLVAELVGAGRLVPVEVDGWGEPAFLHPEVTTPRRVEGRALVSPFDSLVWDRDRTARLFGFDYRIEIYVPKPKRVYGYYVLPFLLDGQLAARVDLKADRHAGVLRVQAAHLEDDLDNPADRAAVAVELAAELHDMADWLGLEAVGATDVGNLAADLRRTPVEPL